MCMKMSTSSRMAIRAPAPSMRVAAPIRGRSVVVRAVVDKAKVMEDVRTVISSQLAVDLSKVQPDANFVDLGADSLDTVEIMMALEEKFEITMDEEGAEKIFTVQEAVDMIAAQIALKA